MSRKKSTKTERIEYEGNFNELKYFRKKLLSIKNYSGKMDISV